MSLGQRTALNALMLVSARTASRVVVLVSVIVQQRALGGERYGEFATVVVISNIASIVADLGLQVVFVREASRHRDNLEEYLAVSLGAKLPLGAISGALLAGAVLLLAPSLMSLVPATFALLLVTSLANLLRSSFYATGEARWDVVAITGETAVLMAGTLLAAWTHQGVAAYIWAYAASYGFTVVYAAAVTHRRYARLRMAWRWEELRPLLRSGLPFALAFVLNTVYFKVDVVILQALRGFTQVGYYNAAYKYIEGLSFIPQAVMNAVFPALSVVAQRGPAAMRSAYTRAYRLLAGMGMPIAVGCSVLAPAIVHYTRALPEAAPSLRILSLTLFFIFVVNSFIFVLGALDRQLTFALLTGMSVAVNVALNLGMIPLFPYDQGLIASSWATVLTEAFLFAAGYVAMSRYLGRLPWLRPARTILLSGAAMAAVMVALLDHAPVVVTALAGTAVYVGGMVLGGGVTRDEWAMARAMLRRPAATAEVTSESAGVGQPSGPPE